MVANTIRAADLNRHAARELAAYTLTPAACEPQPQAEADQHERERMSREPTANVTRTHPSFPGYEDASCGFTSRFELRSAAFRQARRAISVAGPIENAKAATNEYGQKTLGIQSNRRGQVGCRSAH
jgi:hypothetical protein